MGGGNLSKGFAISGVLYPILILVVFIIVQMLTMLGTRKMVLDQNKNQLIDSLNSNGKVYTNEELTTLLVNQQETITSLQNELKSKYATKSDLSSSLSGLLKLYYCANGNSNSCTINFGRDSGTAICFIGPPTGGYAAITSNTSIYFVGWYQTSGTTSKVILQNTFGIKSYSGSNGNIKFTGTYSAAIEVRCYQM